MYLQHFGLREFPFESAPDPRFFFAAAQHAEVLERLVCALEQRKGLMLLTGERGLGKSLLCRAALERFNGRTDSAWIGEDPLSPKLLLQSVCSAFGVPTRNRSKGALLDGLRESLTRSKAFHRAQVLVVDDAQDLTTGVLEELRLLTNLEEAGEPLLQIVLVGRSEVRRALSQRRLCDLDQRVAARWHVGPLSSGEVAGYIDHRLRAAGAWRGDVFQPAAKAICAQSAAGVPGLVNVLCDQSLLRTYINDERVVSAEIMRQVVEDRQISWVYDRGETASDAERAGTHAASDGLAQRPVRAGTTIRTKEALHDGQ